ncbi:hypothetical protein PBAL39_07050 [Pedobacter sp. BAL39]|uniref:hypothetical protein n=1 Tax=Pedobacter sp. BAL39 TaxID=391596 RepID=UPI000155B17A|nr:hypothetical protein [Pedobacter sp. BAL39]EDM34040.1 hypothetical protein PBAL39_07050 [Pedobacter sp. BAL39]
MKNKQILKSCILICCILSLTIVKLKADVSTTGFKIPPSYLVSGTLNVPNPTLKTAFKFEVTFMRNLLSTGGYEDVTNATVTLVYSNCGQCGNYTAVSTPRQLQNSDFTTASGLPKANATLSLDSELPANLVTPGNPGTLYVRLKYFDSNQNKELIIYTNASINVSISPAWISPEILNIISNMDFATDDATATGNYYLVEQDIMLLKDYVNFYSSNKPIIPIANHNINILIGQELFSNSIWYDAIYRAVMAWNSMPNNDIKLNLIKNAPNFAQPQQIDVRVTESSSLNKVPVISEFPSNDGKPGRRILFNSNFRYLSNNSTVSLDQATWNFVQAIGHCLGLRHAPDQMSVMRGGTAGSSYNNNLNSTYDTQTISALFPKNATSQVTPFISGLDKLRPMESANYEISYTEFNLNYSWKVIGINGTNYLENYDYIQGSKLPEVYFPAGNYQIQCTITGGKYNGSVMATKNIIVN